MIDVPASALGETRDCRIANCDRDASDSARKGPYANLCAIHLEDAKARRSVEGKRVGGIRHSDEEPKQEDPSGEPAGSLKDAAAALVRPAATLEKAVEAHKLTREQRKAAFDVFQDALAKVKRAAEELLAG